MSTAGSLRSASNLSVRDKEILIGLADRIETGDAGGHNNLGVLYFNKGLIEEAVAQFNLALEVDPGMPVALRNLEIAYLATGYYERSLVELTERLRGHPTDRDARWRLVRAHRYTGHLEEAKAELRRLLADAPNESRYLVELGRAEKDSGAFSEAREAYERALTVDPDSAVLHFHLGELQYHQGNSAEARRLLLRAIDLAPGFAEAYHLLSFVLGDLGEAEQATDAIGRAHEMGPWLKEAQAGLSIDRNSVARYEELLGEKTPRPVALRDRFLARYHLGVAFRQKGLYEDALREFDRAIESGEDRTLVTQAKAEVLLVAGRDTEAAELYGGLVREDGASPKVWNELGICHHRAGDLSEAEYCYRRALEIDPGYAISENNLAVALANGGDRAGAKAGLEGLLGKHPNFTEARCNLGLLALEEGRRREALAAFRAAVEADPQASGGWLGIGAVLSETEELQEARKALARAVEIAPESAEARYRLAFVLSRLGDIEGSLRETRQALSLNPFYTNPRLKLSIELQFEYAEVLAPELIRPTRVPADVGIADFRIEAGELSGIFAGLRGAADPKGGPANYLLARDYLTKGLLIRALAELRRAALAGGDPVEEALLTGDIYRKQRLEGEALERFDKALSHLGNSGWSVQHERAWLGRGWSLLALDRVESAAKAAGVVLERSPECIEALRLEAETLLNGGRSEEALERFTRLSGTTPRDPALLMRAGAAARAAGRIEPARRALQQALELDPHLLAVRVELGNLCLDQGAYAEAAEHGRAALDALPGYAEAAVLVAEAEQAQGRSSEAISVLADLLADDPYHLHALHRLGEILLAAGRALDAAVAFRRILRFDAGSAGAWASLGDCLDAADDAESAVGCWRRALATGLDDDAAAVARQKIEHLAGRDTPVRRSA
jgi:cellulose synthase operon protein C